MARKRSPSALSMEKLSADGWLADTVERHIPYTRLKKDLFGGFDHLAVRAGEILAVQSTSRSNVSARVNKIRALPHFQVLQASGMQMVVWGWDQDKSGNHRLREVWLSPEK